jgi:hypothetical protein
VAIAVVTRKENPSANPRQFAALHMSAPGTKLPIQDVRYSVAIEGKADVRRARQDRRD